MDSAGRVRSVCTAVEYFNARAGSACNAAVGYERAGETMSANETVPVELSVVMPCLNEAETLAVCVDKALAALRENGIAGEVVVADNGSTDGSQAIAIEHGARVVHPGGAGQVCADGRRR
jgi:hypothetical protein